MFVDNTCEDIKLAPTILLWSKKWETIGDIVSIKYDKNIQNFVIAQKQAKLTIIGKNGNLVKSCTTSLKQIDHMDLLDRGICAIAAKEDNKIVFFNWQDERLHKTISLTSTSQASESHQVADMETFKALDGKIWIGFTDGSLKIYDYDRSEEIVFSSQTLLEGPIRDFEIGPNGGSMVVFGDNEIAVLDKNSYEKLVVIRNENSGTGQSSCKGIVTKSEIIYNTNDNKTIGIWDFGNSEIKRSKRTPSEILCMALGAQGELITTHADGFARIWN